jgi:hypothetical protein
MMDVDDANDGCEWRIYRMDVNDGRTMDANDERE